MNVYAISDLHLSGAVTKPMDIFGNKWLGHFEKICADWNSRVCDGDVVLVCGDISWGNVLSEGLYDLNRLKGLKGTKIFIKGNHDFWWNGITKLRDSRPDDSFIFLQNDSVKIGDIVFCGSRGWTCPGSTDYTEQDNKIYLREAERFKLCFRSAEKLRTEGDKLYALIHYPPYSLKQPDTLFTEQFEANGVNKVIFGHLHGDAYFPLKSERNGIEYYLTSCDKTGFMLTRIS
ncbi:MAG: metallophosphoesterase [Clostridia bacterium]|nr:metallophosphoesterase [Clostridia bacterium]